MHAPRSRLTCACGCLRLPARMRSHAVRGLLARVCDTPSLPLPILSLAASRPVGNSGSSSSMAIDAGGSSAGWSSTPSAGKRSSGVARAAERQGAGPGAGSGSGKAQPDTVTFGSGKEAAPAAPAAAQPAAPAKQSAGGNLAAAAPSASAAASSTAKTAPPAPAAAAAKVTGPAAPAGPAKPPADARAAEKAAAAKEALEHTPAGGVGACTC